MMKKERVDTLLVQKGLAETREKAKRAIMAGLVFSGNERMDKPGTKIDPTLPLEMKGGDLRYVGRGGLKLEKALAAFDLNVADRIVLDIGASTGGFTDCCLQHGAALVYALDVGFNQLAWKLRRDSRVIVMERMNFRYASRSDFTHGLPSFATIDVSFISLKLILPVLTTIFHREGTVIALVKPQFEAGRDEVGKKGVVKDRRIHRKVVREIVDFSSRNGFSVNGLTYSPITGGDGNIEYLLLLRYAADQASHVDAHMVSHVVSEAHRHLG